jgi:hypothetical protein
LSRGEIPAFEFGALRKLQTVYEFIGRLPQLSPGFRLSGQDPQSSSSPEVRAA